MIMPMKMMMMVICYTCYFFMFQFIYMFQVIGSSDPTDHLSGTAHIHTTHDIVIGNDSVTEVAMVASQSEAQSANALLGLAKAQADEGQVQVSDILAAHRHTEHVMNEQEQV